MKWKLNCNMYISYRDCKHIYRAIQLQIVSIIIIMSIIAIIIYLFVDYFLQVSRYR